MFGFNSITAISFSLIATFLLQEYYGSTGIFLYHVSAFKLSSLFGRSGKEDSASIDAFHDIQYPFPRRDLRNEFGEDGYRRLVARAFGEDEKEAAAVTSTAVNYGVDVSYPIHNLKVSSGDLGDKQAFYEEQIQGCREKYSSDSRICDSSEIDRVHMNLSQPPTMQNYTDLGFQKTRAPPTVMKMLEKFWEQNQNLAYEENWAAGNTYTNHWSSPTYMLSVENPELLGGGFELKNRIWDAARDTIQEWIGETLTPCSLYGIRIYNYGSILAPHVDRLPLVSSAIINVAQDVDEDWPIELYAHDGKAYNITMKPGDMLLYESHSIIHGRPFPLEGRYYANVFIHFEPTGHTLQHNSFEGEDYDDADNAKELFKKAQKLAGESDLVEKDDLPSYIVRGSLEEKRWRQQEEYTKEKMKATFQTGTSTAHAAASSGNLKKMKEIAKTNSAVFHLRDSNGWQPIHEAARGGHTEIVKLLVEHGADYNTRTNNGQGATALWWASTVHGEDHPVTKYLKELNAVNLGPDL